MDARPVEGGSRAGRMDGAVVLHWIPLGAGAHVVKLSGRVYESVSARLHHRRPTELFHSALTLSLPEGSYVVEQAPVPDLDGLRRGVVAQGPVGLRCAGRIRAFRYEVRCWPGGVIPDLACPGTHAHLVSSDPATARRIVRTIASIPTPTWGRDELRTGQMWNSNSVVAWVLTRSGVDATRLVPPDGGRAPGWGAGVEVASRTGEPSVRGGPVSDHQVATHRRSPGGRARLG